jgi:hypothetical protein
MLSAFLSDLFEHGRVRLAISDTETPTFPKLIRGLRNGPLKLF